MRCDRNVVASSNDAAERRETSDDHR